MISDLEGDAEGFGAFLAGDDGAFALAGALDEGGDFEFEGFVFFDFDGFANDLVAVFAVDPAALVLVVEGEVAVGLEDADFAHFLGADAGGGEVGDAAVFEFEAGVGDVLALHENRDADGVDVDEGALHQVEDDFDVVDHEIEHDADVDAAIGEGGEAVGFNEAGGIKALFELAEDGVESLDMADLEDGVVGLGEVDEELGLGVAFGDGFFDEDVAAFSEEDFADGTMVDGGDGDGGGVHGVGEGMKIGDDGDVILGGEFFGAGGVGVVDASEDEAGVTVGGEFGHDADVVAADGAAAGDADAEGGLGGGHLNFGFRISDCGVEKVDWGVGLAAETGAFEFAAA